MPVNQQTIDALASYLHQRGWKSRWPGVDGLGSWNDKENGGKILSFCAAFILQRHRDDARLATLDGPAPIATAPEPAKVQPVAPSPAPAAAAPAAVERPLVRFPNGTIGPMPEPRTLRLPPPPAPAAALPQAKPTPSPAAMVQAALAAQRGREILAAAERLQRHPPQVIPTEQLQDFGNPFGEGEFEPQEEIGLALTPASDSPDFLAWPGARLNPVPLVFLLAVRRLAHIGSIDLEI